MLEKLLLVSIATAAGNNSIDRAITPFHSAPSFIDSRSKLLRVNSLRDHVTMQHFTLRSQVEPADDSHQRKYPTLGGIFSLVALASAIPNTPVTREHTTDRSRDRVPEPADPSPPGRRRVTRRDRAEIVRLYESGLAARLVAEQVGVSKGCVLKTLKTEGIAMRPRGNPGWSRQ